MPEIPDCCTDPIPEHWQEQLRDKDPRALMIENEFLQTFELVHPSPNECIMPRGTMIWGWGVWDRVHMSLGKTFAFRHHMDFLDNSTAYSGTMAEGMLAQAARLKHKRETEAAEGRAAASAASISEIAEEGRFAQKRTAAMLRQTDNEAARHGSNLAEVIARETCE